VAPNAPRPLSPAERVFDELRTAHMQFVAQAESAGNLPAWYVLTPAGPLRIKTIAKFYSFIEFVTGDGNILLVAPDAVSVMMKRLLPESDEPRFPIGFAPPEAQDTVLPSDASD
jgi:hypothetical protein